jgi:hypothetical protein
MIQYTLVHQNGMPLINDATADPDSYILEPGQRLLVDSPPEYDPETQALRRVEPVPDDATQIEYIILFPKPVIPDFIKRKFGSIT